MPQPLRHALVTGASTGLGLETALTLARAGYDVALADIRADMLDEAMRHPDLTGVKSAAVTLDLLSEQSMRDGFSAATAALGPIDILVNNAGRPLMRPVVDVTWAEWDSVMDVNLKGAYFLAGHVARACIADGRPGSIVNIASTHGMTGLAGRSVYGISKGGLIQMARMLAIEWAEHGIRVNCVAPTTVLTPSRQELLPEGERRERAKSRIPTGRFPDAWEIAAAVRYLVSDDAISVTGHTLPVDGGLMAE
jgi:NAD(P)-dependent dehydrogenase (short-subunit alcohol dehydrogenase family)